MAKIEGVIDYLQSKHVAVLSTVTKEGAPQSATIFFHTSDIDRDARTFSIYFVTRRHTRKFSNLLASHTPKVSMVVGTELDRYSVQIDGVAEFIEASNSVQGLFDLGGRLLTDPALAMLYLGEFYPKNPFGSIEGSDFAVFKIVPTWVRYMHPDTSGQKLVYSQIKG